MPIKLNIPIPSLGLVVDRPAEFVDSRSVTAIRNMEFNRSIIRKRSGSVGVGASLAERVMKYFELQVGSQTRLVRVGRTKVQDLNKTTATWASVTSTPLTGASTDNVSVAFPLLSGEKIAVFTNGKDAIRKIALTANDAALGGSPPLARYAQAFGPYLVIAWIIDGGNTYYSRVQWCDTGDPETWSGGNAGSVDLLEDPEDITGLGVFGNFLTVHKTKSIYLGQLVSTSDVFRFDRKPTGVGAVAGATIANIPSGEQIFLASDGIHLFNGITAPLIDSPIQDELRETMTPSILKSAHGIFVEELDEYWCAVGVGNDTEPSTVYKYNWRTRQIYKDTHDQMTAMGLYINTNETTWDSSVGTWESQTGTWDGISNLSLNSVVMYGDLTGNSTSRSNGAADDGASAVEAVWETKDFTSNDFGGTDMDGLMRWKGLQLWALGATVDVQYSTDCGETWSTATTLTLNSRYPTDSAPLHVWIDTVSTTLRLRFSNYNSGEKFTIKKYILKATPREAIR